MRDSEHLRRQIGQLMIFGFEGYAVSDTMADLIRRHYIGNVIFFSRNVKDAAQVRELTQSLQHLARESGQELPLTISADQENGIVRRLPAEIPGLPGNMALGAAGRTEYVRRSGALTGQWLRHLGINCNLAPVLDVNNNPDNPVIGVRSFGDQARTVAEYGVEFLTALQAEGVIACGKHFPGHGDTKVDSHLGLPVIGHDRARLDQLELVPFVEAISASIDAIMTAHVVFPAVEPDGVPATLSHRVLTNLLRDQLGFRGALTTDCLEMDAISKTVGVARGAVEAIKAGADLIMVSHRLDRQLAALEAVFQAAMSGEIPESRIEEAAERVRALKMRRLQNAPPLTAWDTLKRETANLQRELAGEALTRLKWTDGIPANPRRVAILADEMAPVMAAAGRAGPRPLLEDAMRRKWPAVKVRSFRFPSVLSQATPDDLLAELKGYDVVIAGINGGQNGPYAVFLRQLFHEPVPQVAFLLRSPYDAAIAEDAPNLLALYESTPWMTEAAVEALFGGPAEGHLPVEVSPKFRRGYRASREAD